MSASKDTRGALKVLIVEDHHDARTTMRMLLSMGYGHVVYEAADGASGVRCALELRPDVALIDLGLPDLDGTEVARRIRAVLDKSEILLIALTGYGSAEDQRLAQEAGFDVHLLKPVESAALQRIFANVIRARENASGTSNESGQG
jgi:CheY-like chemotaxis protein